MKEKFETSELLVLLSDDATQRQAFTWIMQTHQQKIYWHIRKMVIVHDDANDILQNTFLKAWSSIKKFRGECQILTWLYKIATNETIDFLNSQKSKNNAIDLQDALVLSMESPSYFNGNEAQAKLQKAILELPQKQRLVFNMRYFDEIPYEEMSKILNTSVGALKASYHHAVKKIEKYILQCN